MSSLPLGVAEPRYPFKVIYLELTNVCNFTCDYCPIDQQTRGKATMSGDFARNVLDQIADNRLTDIITFHVMGEPYLHRDFCRLTEYAESRGLHVRLLTNGSLLTTKTTEQLFAAGLYQLEIGFRTPNESSFAMRLRGGKLTLDDYIERVRVLIDDTVRLQPTTTVLIKFFIRSKAADMGLGDPYEHLTSEQDNLALARTFQSFVLESARRHGKATDGWDSLPIRICDGFYEIYPRIALSWSRIQDFWVREQRGASSNWKAVVCGCTAGFREDFAILASGEVTTCCVDYDGKNIVGDLRKQTLMDVIGSPQAQAMKRSLQWFRPPTEFCAQCKGAPTLGASILKQAGTVYLDAKARLLGRSVKTL